MSFSIPTIGHGAFDSVGMSGRQRTLLKPPIKDANKLIEFFLLSLHDDWRPNINDSFEEANKKAASLEYETKLLGVYTRATVIALMKELEFNPKYSTDWTWVKCPPELKQKYYDLLERIASAGSIPIDACIDGWMTKLLLGRGTHNRLGPKKVYFYC